MDRRLFLGAATATLATPAWAQFGLGRGASGPAAVAISSRDDGLSQAATLLDRSARYVVAPASKIVAPFLTIEIVEELGRVVRERQYRAGAVASSKFTVEGLDDSAIQGVVDRLYPQILTQLTDAGHTIIGRDEARANAEFAKLIAAEKTPMWQSNTAGGGKSKFFAPTGMGPYFTPGDARFGTFSAFGMSTAQIMGEVQAPTQLNATIMGIELGVRFVNVATEGGGQYSNLFGTGIASIRGKAVMSLDPSRTRVWFRNPGMTGERTFMTLNKPVGPANNPIIAFDDITSNASKAQDIAAGLIGALAGGGPSYQTRAYRIALDREAFPVALEGCFTGVTAAMINQIGVTGRVVRPR